MHAILAALVERFGRVETLLGDSTDKQALCEHALGGRIEHLEQQNQVSADKHAHLGQHVSEQQSAVDDRIERVEQLLAVSADKHTDLQAILADELRRHMCMHRKKTRAIEEANKQIDSLKAASLILIN